jgi:hypothetical protein
MALAKASLQALTGAAKPTEDGAPFDVQFNPATLHLQMTNNVEGGEARHRPAQQFTGTSSTTLTLDLHFDTADEGSNGTFKNVREKSAIVRRFVTPAKGASKQAPPRVRFLWGDFVFIGVVTSVNEDIDLFSAQGVPLHSKCTVTIKEQDPRFAALAMGAGAATGANAVPAGANPSSANGGGGSNGSTGGGSAPGGGGPGGAGPGGGPAPGTDRTAAAIGGESAAEFAARMGVDPSAWRGLAAGVGSPLSLSAGLEIDFSSGLSSAPGIGVSAGVASGASASPEAALGLAPAAGAGGGAGAASAQGFALAAAGGVGAALQTAQIAKAAAAVAQAREAFAVPPAPAAGAPASAGAAPAPAAPAPPPPVADPRTTGFGFGVPLRPTVGGAVQARAAVVHGWLAPRTVASHLPADPTRPRWSLLVPSDLLDTAPASTQAHAAGRDCGCGCGCGGRG